MSLEFLERALRSATGKDQVRVLDTAPLAGGCIHDARRLRTTEGDFFAKWSAKAAADIFVREAAGLRALREAASGLRIPEVIASAERTAEIPGFLILEFLAPLPAGEDSPDREQEEQLGRGLAAVHRATSRRFGFSEPSYCGATYQDNSYRDTWRDFYAQCRLMPLLADLQGTGQLSSSDRAHYDRLLNRLHVLIPNEATPSLIHGDLWSGNVLWTARGPALVDPACAYADREMEFGMVTLFGGLSATSIAAYEEAWPLPGDWVDRNPLYQLYHLLNHALLFGGGYLEQARRIVRRYAG